jgi:hypothetical protein
MKISLDTPKRDGISYCRLDEVSQCFARMEHGLKLGAQGWFDADLRDNGGFHPMIVLRLSYVIDGWLHDGKDQLRGRT